MELAHLMSPDGFDVAVVLPCGSRPDLDKDRLPLVAHAFVQANASGLSVWGSQRAVVHPEAVEKSLSPATRSFRH
jgi:hypothetical protein